MWGPRALPGSPGHAAFAAGKGAAASPGHAQAWTARGLHGAMGSVHTHYQCAMCYIRALYQTGRIIPQNRGSRPCLHHPPPGLQRFAEAPKGVRRCARARSARLWRKLFSWWSGSLSVGDLQPLCASSCAFTISSETYICQHSSKHPKSQSRALPDQCG